MDRGGVGSNTIKSINNINTRTAAEPLAAMVMIVMVTILRSRMKVLTRPAKPKYIYKV